MAIDRIGKGGSAGGPGSTTGAGAPSPTSAPATTGQPFEVRRSEQAGAAQAGAGAAVGGVASTTPLEQLRAGKIDVNGYMDLKVNEATAHLSGLGAADLDAIRRMLRDKLASDPALADLVRGATGQSPAAANPDE